MDEDSFKCVICGGIVKESDYDKDNWFIFRTLKRAHLCEGCARRVSTEFMDWLNRTSDLIQTIHKQLIQWLNDTAKLLASETEE